jgi:hypothetical protein
VQVLRVAEVYYTEPNWYVNQRVIGSIAWPQTVGEPPATPVPEQFTIKVESITVGETTINAVKVAIGRVITESLTDGNYAPPKPVTQSYSVEKFAVYPTSLLTVGGDANSLWVSDDGYVQLLNASEGGANLYNIYLIRNNFGTYIGPSFGDPGYPMLAVMALDSDAELKSRSFGFAGDTAAWRHIYVYKTVTVATLTPPYEVSFRGGVSQSDALANYDCQRLKIGNVYWTGTQWLVTQELIGTLTLPNYIRFTGTVDWDEDSASPAPWVTWPTNSSENDAWHGAWSGYDKSATGSTVTITN